VQIKNLPGIRMVLILYPYVVAGGFTVNDDDVGGVYNAHFGLVTTSEPPVCKRGYESTDERPATDTGNRPMNEKARCSDPNPGITPRGAQHAPRVAPFARAGQAGVDAPVIGTYHRATGEFTYDDAGTAPEVVYTGGSAARYGDQSWMQLLMQPVLP
jgi:phospholipid/cholesterol/gamma-HCH transport system substrate-binding protein